MPRSPCSDPPDAERRRGAVEVKVAAILVGDRRTSPLPKRSPGPLAPARISIARAKGYAEIVASAWTAAARAQETRLPRSTSRSEPAQVYARTPPDRVPDVHGESTMPQAGQGTMFGPSDRRARGIGMRLEEETVGACGRGGVEQRWNEGPLAAARPIAPCPAAARSAWRRRSRALCTRAQAARNCACRRRDRRNRRTCRARDGTPAPALPNLFDGPGISSGAIHWPFLMFTGRLPCRQPRAKSVWRQRNAGYCNTSATRAASGTWPGHGRRSGSKPGAARTFSSARSPDSSPGPRGAFRARAIALSYDAL